MSRNKTIGTGGYASRHGADARRQPARRRAHCRRMGRQPLARAGRLQARLGEASQRCAVQAQRPDARRFASRPHRLSRLGHLRQSRRQGPHDGHSGLAVFGGRRRLGAVSFWRPRGQTRAPGSREPSRFRRLGLGLRSLARRHFLAGGVTTCLPCKPRPVASGLCPSASSRPVAKHHRSDSSASKFPASARLVGIAVMDHAHPINRPVPPRGCRADRWASATSPAKRSHMRSGVTLLCATCVRPGGPRVATSGSTDHVVLGCLTVGSAACRVRAGAGGWRCIDPA
jgi:hypothetical protein